MITYLIIGILVAIVLFGITTQAPISKERREMAERAAEEAYRRR